jgi:predicted nuclease with TOPRIM domain
MPRDNSPVKHTCPDIDDAQSIAKSAIDSMSDATGYFKDLIKKLELLREENAELRAWGNEESNRADEAERDLDDVRREIKSLESDVKYLNDEIKSLETQLQETEQVNN